MQSEIDYLKSNGLWLSRATQLASWGLVDIITERGPGQRGIEIGVQTGLNSYMLLEFCPNIEKIVGIDPYLSYKDWDKVVPQSDQDHAFKVFSENWQHMKNRFELVKQGSNDAAKLLKDDSYDFIFVDGDHCLRQVLNDLDNYVPKVKNGGIIAGHDIGIGSVTMAIQSWCKRHNIDLNQVHLIENTAWYWIKE